MTSTIFDELFVLEMANNHWGSVERGLNIITEFSRMMGRQPRTIREWVDEGTLAEFGIPVCQFRHGKRHSGRSFILNIY